jgi:hypothetical protein
MAAKLPFRTRLRPSTSASRSRGASEWSTGPTFASRTDSQEPERPPRWGRQHAARQRRERLRHLIAWATGTALLGLGVLIVGDLERTRALVNVIVLWTMVLAIDFVISFSYTVRPRLPAGT